MSKELKRVRGMTLFTAAALLLSFYAYFTINTSVAWFSNNTEVDAYGMQVACDGERIIDIEVRYHHVTKIEGDYYTYVESDGAAKLIPIYDPAQIDSGDYKNALIIELTYTTTEPIACGISIGYDNPASALNSYNDLSKFANGSATDTLERYYSDVMHLGYAEVSNGVAVVKSENPKFFSLTSTKPSDEGTYLFKETELSVHSVTASSYAQDGANYKYTVYFVTQYNTEIVDFITDYRISQGKFGTVEYKNDLIVTITESSTSQN